MGSVPEYDGSPDITPVAVGFDPMLVCSRVSEPEAAEQLINATYPAECNGGEAGQTWRIRETTPCPHDNERFHYLLRSN
jgi:hypothetical protein